jgi:hypothetical protein
MKAAFCETIEKGVAETINNNNLEDAAAYLEYVSSLDGNMFPEILFKEADVKTEIRLTKFSYLEKDHVTCGLHVCLPNQQNMSNPVELIWMPWLPCLKQPVRNPGDFHQIRFGAMYYYQARRTKCYGHAYPYSGQIHPLEPETPAEIEQLYHFANAFFGYADDGVGGFNMCLENDYANCRHYISEHSDDENTFGDVHDVCCFVTGNASREALFRRVKQHKGELKETDASRTVLRIKLPAGIYVMRGKVFQQLYTHEFPQMEETLFKKLCEKLAQHPAAKGFPVEVEKGLNGASMKGIVQADWIVANKDLVKKLIQDGLLLPKKIPKNFSQLQKQDLESFDRWCCYRTSYTLRNFKN